MYSDLAWYTEIKDFSLRVLILTHWMQDKLYNLKKMYTNYSKAQPAITDMDYKIKWNLGMKQNKNKDKNHMG